MPRHRRRLPALLAFALAGGLLVVACGLRQDKAADGAACSEPSDCKSGRCSDGFCVGSPCSCEGTCAEQGAPSADCAEGWLCRRYHTDTFFGLFDSVSDLCTPLCGSCTPGWKCLGSATFCEYQPNPEVEVLADKPRVATGEPVTFRAQASSPVGAGIVSYTWGAAGRNEKTEGGPEFSISFAEAGAYAANVAVRDEKDRIGSAAGSVKVCARATDPCRDNGDPDACCEGVCAPFGGRSICLPPCTSCPEGWACAPGAAACTPQPPSVAALVSPSPNALRNDTLSFHADVASRSGAPIANVGWVFEPGNGQQASGTDVTHRFTKSGTYEVVVKAYDEAGAEASASVNVIVCIPKGESCSPAFSDSLCCEGSSCSAFACE